MSSQKHVFRWEDWIKASLDLGDPKLSFTAQDIKTFYWFYGFGDLLLSAQDL